MATRKTAVKKTPVKKATKKAPVKKVVKKAPPKAAPVCERQVKINKAMAKKVTPKATTAKVTKVEQATAILQKARKANKKVTRKDVIKLIVKAMKCTEARAGGHYQAAQKRITDK